MALLASEVQQEQRELMGLLVKTDAKARLALQAGLVLQASRGKQELAEPLVLSAKMVLQVACRFAGPTDFVQVSATRRPALVTRRAPARHRLERHHVQHVDQCL